MRSVAGDVCGSALSAREELQRCTCGTATFLDDVCPACGAKLQGGRFWRSSCWPFYAAFLGAVFWEALAVVCVLRIYGLDAVIKLGALGVGALLLLLQFLYVKKINKQRLGEFWTLAAPREKGAKRPFRLSFLWGSRFQGKLVFGTAASGKSEVEFGTEPVKAYFRDLERLEVRLHQAAGPAEYAAVARQAERLEQIYLNKRLAVLLLRCYMRLPRTATEGKDLELLCETALKGTRYFRSQDWRPLFRFLSDHILTGCYTAGEAERKLFQVSVLRMARAHAAGGMESPKMGFRRMFDTVFGREWVAGQIRCAGEDPVPEQMPATPAGNRKFAEAVVRHVSAHKEQLKQSDLWVLLIKYSEYYRDQEPAWQVYGEVAERVRRIYGLDREPERSRDLCGALWDGSWTTWGEKTLGDLCLLPEDIRLAYFVLTGKRMQRTAN